MKKNFEHLKLLFKAVRDARVAKNDAKLAMCSYSNFYDDEKPEHSCINSTNVMDEHRPLYISSRCESFNANNVCENKQCPNFDRNARYVKACVKYELACCARSEFIKGLFIRSK